MHSMMNPRYAYAYRIALCLLNEERKAYSKSRSTRRIVSLQNEVVERRFKKTSVTRPITDHNDPERRFGFFKCPTCRGEWRSSWAWCYAGTNQPSSGQQCKNSECPDDFIKPYRVQPLLILCPKCKSVPPCNCKPDRKKKPHRGDLCERCLKNEPCKYRDY